MTEQSQDSAVLAIEQVIVNGNLASLTPAQRMRYYKMLCDALGLNYLTRPFEYLTVQGKMILYARRDATDQLRKIHDIAVEIVDRARYEDVWVVTARARTSTGRTDEAVGAVSLVGLKGLELANALMKAETKAKRRVTLSICGLGWSDESEVDGIIGALSNGPQIKAIAPARKFADLSDQEKREQLEKGWWKRIEQLGLQDEIEAIVLPNFAEEPLDNLIAAAGILGEALKETERERIIDTLLRIHDVLGKDDLNGVN